MQKSIEFTRRSFLLLTIVAVLIIIGMFVGLYILGNSQGYQAGNTAGYSSGYSNGNTAGYAKGKQDGYSSGVQDGYNQGYQFAGGNIQNWVYQHCSNYPFLLLDPSQYVACQRYAP